MKKIIRLTESELKNIIKESVGKVLNEGDFGGPDADLEDLYPDEYGREEEPISDVWKRKREDDMMDESVNEAESGVWVVDSSEAQEAYNLAVQEMGEDTINSAIVRNLGDEALAQCLAYIFRQYDFRQWQSRFDSQEGMI